MVISDAVSLVSIVVRLCPNQGWASYQHHSLIVFTDGSATNRPNRSAGAHPVVETGHISVRAKWATRAVLLGQPRSPNLKHTRNYLKPTNIPSLPGFQQATERWKKREPAHHTIPVGKPLYDGCLAMQEQGATRRWTEREQSYPVAQVDKPANAADPNQISAHFCGKAIL